MKADQAPTAETSTSTPTPLVSPTASGTVESSPNEKVTVEATAAATAEPTPSLPGVYRGIWISEDELAQLPTQGTAWENLIITAAEKVKKPDLGDQDDDSNVIVLAKALVYARTGETDHRNDVRDAIEYITTENTEKGGRTLALGRELVAYVIAADLINLPELDPDLDQLFREKLTELLTKKLQNGRTLTNTHEQRPNNWGTHAGASRAAIAIYLWDPAELEKTAQVFKGWLGDRDAYSNFEYGNMSWQCSSREPVGINPIGCTKDDILIDGAQPEEMRRGGKFQWPPKETGYPWEALQGALVQAIILHRAGYDVWEWQDRALLRAVEFLYSVEWVPEGDDMWLPWLINFFYNTEYPTVSPVRAGKNMGFTDWTHAPSNKDQILAE
ncbi:MAG: alginate lyase family protein [Candidatus Promineifilaceae bacterium]|nr:alginate lyase family protein [Candidatus Promineifilaceae bacterium]